MKKSFLIILFLSISVFSFSQDNEWALYKQFPVLEENEQFDWVYDTEFDALYIVKKRGAIKTLYTYINFVDWGNWQFSGNRREILFYRNEGYNYSDHTYYILDGNTGKTQKIDIPTFGTTNNDLQYILVPDYTNNDTNRLLLIDVHSQKIEDNFIWTLSSDEYLKIEDYCLYIYRSLIPNYDFHVYLTFSSYIAGECYINIKTKEIKTVCDGLTEEKITDYNHTDYELGW